MNKSDEFKVCSREPKPWKGEAFWRKVDKFMEIFDHRAYWYVCLGMILVGTILGVIAQYLK